MPPDGGGSESRGSLPTVRRHWDGGRKSGVRAATARDEEGPESGVAADGGGDSGADLGSVARTVFAELLLRHAKTLGEGWLQKGQVKERERGNGPSRRRISSPSGSRVANCQSSFTPMSQLALAASKECPARNGGSASAPTTPHPQTAA